MPFRCTAWRLGIKSLNLHLQIKSQVLKQIFLQCPPTEICALNSKEFSTLNSFKDTDPSWSIDGVMQQIQYAFNPIMILLPLMFQPSEI
jgi:hypothetical protein